MAAFILAFIIFAAVIFGISQLVWRSKGRDYQDYFKENERKGR